METVFNSVVCEVDTIKVLGMENVDSTSLNFLLVLTKYQTYIATNSLTEYSDKIDKLIFQIENTCCK